MLTSRSDRCVVIGLGSPLMGDDGLGLAALARLRSAWELPPAVEVVDGGTWGMNLLPVIEGADQLLLIDAIEADQPAGTLIRLDREQLPRYLAAKISPHEVDLRDVLALATLRGTLPRDVIALGLQPGSVELRDGLSPAIRDRLDDLVSAVVAVLERWRHSCAPAEGGAPAHA